MKKGIILSHRMPTSVVHVEALEGPCLSIVTDIAFMVLITNTNEVDFSPGAKYQNEDT